MTKLDKRRILNQTTMFCKTSPHQVVLLPKHTQGPVHVCLCKYCCAEKVMLFWEMAYIGYVLLFGSTLIIC